MSFIFVFYSQNFNQKKFSVIFTTLHNILTTFMVFIIKVTYKLSLIYILEGFLNLLNL